MLKLYEYNEDDEYLDDLDLLVDIDKKDWADENYNDEESFHINH